ncbi:hypothetical protein AMTR_s00039p00132000 [Amborella trichopoda]|uniref:Uncharacterized protein n=1 Tax=Amborella trichopoda TaxID=13333 RepID=U5CRF5_AMBTC|nr:hypothetical protein AMTR_s00039p00132000 [Amborella trichopoda]
MSHSLVMIDQEVWKDTFVIKVVVDDGLVRSYLVKETLPSKIVVEGLKTRLVAKVVKSGLSCNGGAAQHKETTQNLNVAGNLDGRRRNGRRTQRFKKKMKSAKILNLFISNLKRKWVLVGFFPDFIADYSRELPCIETMGANTSGVVPASSPPITVAGTISRMLDGTLIG